MRLALRTFIAEKRAQHGFLRENGATVAADRGDTLLDELDALLAAHEDAPEQEYTPAQAAQLTGCNPDVVRRLVRQGVVGRQAGPHRPMRIRQSELVKLVPRHRGRRVLPSASVSFRPDEQATDLLRKLGR